MSISAAVTTNGNQASTDFPTRAQRGGTGSRRTSRTVAMDIVAFGDIAAVALGALLPAFIYSHFGDIPTNWAIVIQSGLIGGFIAYLWLRNAGMYDIEKFTICHNTRCTCSQGLRPLSLLSSALLCRSWHCTGISQCVSYHGCPPASQ